MKTPLRVLIIEDSEDDALLLVREIKNKNYDVTFQRVDTSDALSEALNQQKWDIIISDYKMPHFSVSEALELLRNSGLDLPFIIVSGVIGEEAAVDSLKAGAHDFIMKSNFSRLIPAIKRELNEAEVRRSKRIAEKKLKHLNLVLRAIRNVNQLIIREKDRDRLLKSTCENLIENREYYNAWIILLDESGEFLRHAEAGLGKDFLPIVAQLKRGELPTCCLQALRQEGVVSIKDPSSTCSDCSLTNKFPRRGALTVRLKSHEKVYGLLVTSVPIEFVDDEEEKSLFQEVAGDIAFALYSIELEENRKQAEKALQGSEERYHSLIESSEDPIYLINRDLKYIYANKKLLSRFGKSQDEVFRQEYIKFHSPERTKLFSERIEEVFESRKSVFYEHHSLRDGRYFLRTLSPVINPEIGVVTAVTVISKDITTLKQAEEALRASRDYLETLTNSMWDAVFSVKMPERVIEWVNDSFRLIGYKPSECVGKDTAFLYPDKDNFLDFGNKLKDAMAAGKEVYHTEQLLKRKSGEIFPAEITVTFHRENDEVVSVISIVRDITKRKQAEEETRKMHQGLVEAHEKLQRAYEEEKQLRDKLIQSEKLASLGQMSAKIAHEINNPLTVIYGRAYMWQMKKIDKKLKKTFDLIVKESLRIKNITSTYINLSKPTPARRERLNLNEVIEECVDTMITTGEMKYFKVEKILQSDLPVVIGDRERLIQVFRNLIANAIYAMADNEVKSLTFRSSVLKDKRFVEVSIKDTGYGIVKKDFNKIFDIYYTTKPEELGTGLGLVVVKDIIEKQHKGRILVESEVSKGTTFTIQLPIEKKAKRKILVVDDEAYTRELFTGYFEGKGLDAFEAQNGEEALENFEKIQPDIILTDIQMPFMDGFEFAEKVRVKNPEQKIIFMTGYYFEHDIQSKLEKSNIRYFTKPADFDVVWEMISKELKSETP